MGCPPGEVTVGAAGVEAGAGAAGVEGGAAGVEAGAGAAGGSDGCAPASCALAASTNAHRAGQCRNLEKDKTFYELTSLRCEYNAMRIPKPASRVTTELPP